MEVLEKIEKALNVKIVAVEEVSGRSFPLFDLLNMRGIKLALIKNPLFVVIEGEDVYEKRIEGNFVVVETDKGYLLARYTGEPNIDALRQDSQGAEEPEVSSPAEEVEKEEEETNKEDGEENEEQEDGGDPVKEIAAKLPAWADGAVVVKKNENVVALPIKKSAKKEGAYYASVTWKPLDVRGAEDLVNHIITKSGKAVKANVYVGDRYINIFTSPSRPRRHYSGRRR
jgi:hypothetical protein